jgi:aspartyl/asparaginyl-tRNA synthetase
MRVDGKVKERTKKRSTRPADRRNRSVCHRDRGARRIGRTAFAGLRRAGLPEDTRLKYRFLDLRRETLHANIMTRTKVIRDMRRRMEDAGFSEFQTPILTASSPEGARDFSRAKPHSSGPVLRAAAGAAAVQAAPDGGWALIATFRSRPASAMKTRAPTAYRASSTSSTSR